MGAVKMITDKEKFIKERIAFYEKIEFPRVPYMYIEGWSWYQAILRKGRNKKTIFVKFPRWMDDVILDGDRIIVPGDESEAVLLAPVIGNFIVPDAKSRLELLRPLWEPIVGEGWNVSIPFIFIREDRFYRMKNLEEIDGDGDGVLPIDWMNHEKKWAATLAGEKALGEVQRIEFYSDGDDLKCREC